MKLKPSDHEGKGANKARSWINAVMTHGIFTSVKGTWKNAEGQTITFDEKVCGLMKRHFFFQL